MSLIHWWPLNGNTTDLGISPCTVSGTPAFAANGKIGKCLSGGTLTMPAAATAQAFNKDAVSVCFWLYNGGSAGCIFGTEGMTAPNNRRFTLFQYPTANDLHWSWQNENSGGTFTSGIASGAIPSNAWTHICAVWDKGTARIYVNGVQVATSTGTCTSTNWAYDTIIARPSSARYYNDIRIYNHALSAKEVKEISKGLILHYNFEDEYIEPTTNLISTVNSSNAKLPKAGNGVDLQTTSGDAYCALVLSTALVIGNTYTLSFDVSNLSENEYISFGFYDAGMHNVTTINKNGKASITFTAWNIASSLTFDDSSRNNTTVISLRNFQLEAKDHATPYVNGTRSAGKVYDNSGYGYNGTVTGTPQIVADTGIGAHSVKFDGNTLIKAAGLTTEAKTAIVWYKGAKPSDSRVIFADEGSKLAMGFYNNGSMIISSQSDVQPYYSLSTYNNSGWNCLAVVKGSGNNASQLYINGVAAARNGTNQYWSHSGGLWIGGRSTGSNITGQIGDLKIYATALSAEDILAEYNRKAAIDKNGNLFTGEIIETAGSATKIDKNSFIGSNLFATTMTLEDGSVWAPICVHYVPDGLFTGSSNTFYYKGRNIWENFGAINDLERPESNQWEFYVMQQNTVDGEFSKYRFKQNVSPFSATWEQVNPSKVGTNITRISSSKPNNYAGMYWYNNSNVAMCFANGSNGNWYGCGIRAAFQGGIPGYNGETVKGWQLVYMRISKHKARMFKNGVMIPTDIIEN